MLIEIDADQREVLATLIQRELDDLGPEIHHTRTKSYREDLKVRKERLAQLLDRLAVAQPAAR